MPRLRRSVPGRKGYARVRAGAGFSYRDADGQTVRDPVLRQRFDALVIPPAWTDVWICEHENGHIQATGVDDAGRRQYLYHPVWREQKDRLKFERALALAASLPTARAFVTRALRDPEPSRERTLAAAFRIIDLGSLRVGHARYALAHGSRGLATLRCEHARVDGDVVELRFPGKSRQPWNTSIRDADLAHVVGELLEGRPANAPLLVWPRPSVDEGAPADASTLHPITPADINAYIKERTGGEFTAKDFRTLRGTAIAAESLARSSAGSTVRERTKAVSEAMRACAEALGNTPAVARSSYVDPRVVDRFMQGETIQLSPGMTVESALRAMLGDPRQPE
ncbi:DNA topoisomerase IB [Ruicaihuangia caeni]|uniref:DNA topoisomerase n=1 Tax=Ruicaihuangia caeni TaxID=3042517 RepID=A0AAW6T832_9MICO|nr:DNA topoisomerase IB [Klugiella sp. YN-L-19]MDI2098503.1 DNA topoisomerase IB [Klugiella sp. YN-L-19]